MLLIGFSLSLLIFFAVGMASMRYAQKDVGDYLVANRAVSPVAAGLSAVASNNSGFMFIGAIGFTYAYGLAAIWLFLFLTGPTGSHAVANAAHTAGLQPVIGRQRNGDTEEEA